MKTELRIQHYESGGIKYIRSYLNGVRHGQWAAFYESGLIEFVGNYVEGKGQGIRKEWYSNGSLKEESYYHNNEQYPINFWDESGKQILKDGSGYTIAEFGTNGWDVYHQFFENGVFIREVKVAGVTYGKFIADE